MNLRRLFAVAFAFLAIVTLNAQVVNPVKWSQKIEMTSRDEGVMTFTANIENHWHIYGLDLPDGLVRVPQSSTSRKLRERNLLALLSLP